MAEIFPVTEPRCVADLNRLFGWEARAFEETATPKHATNTVTVNRATSVTIMRKRIVPPLTNSLPAGGTDSDGTNPSKVASSSEFDPSIREQRTCGGRGLDMESGMCTKTMKFLRWKAASYASLYACRLIRNGPAYNRHGEH